MEFLDLPIYIHIKILLKLSVVNFKLLSCTNRYFSNIAAGRVSPEYGKLIDYLYSSRIRSRIHHIKEESMAWRSFYLRVIKFLDAFASGDPINYMIANCDLLEFKILEMMFEFSPKAKAGKYLVYKKNGSEHILNPAINKYIIEIKPQVLIWFCERGILPNSYALNILCSTDNSNQKIKIFIKYGLFTSGQTTAIDSLIAKANIEMLSYLISVSIQPHAHNINYAYFRGDINVIKWFINNIGYPNDSNIRVIITQKNIDVLESLYNLSPRANINQEHVDFAFMNNNKIVTQWFLNKQFFPTSNSVIDAIRFSSRDTIELLYSYMPQFYTLEHIHQCLISNSIKLFYWFVEHCKEIKFTVVTLRIAELNQRRDVAKFIKERLDR